ncbi:MAG: RHS repeat protein, partial [Rhizobacter sp.]|nr:RHS repeat protein [Chlorobiales bacterium]
ENRSSLDRYTDVFGRLVQTRTFSGAPTALVTKFEYDVLDRQTKSINPKGQQTLYGYNALSQLTQKTTPDGGTTKYRYDAKGQLRFVMDQNHANQDVDMQRKFIYYKYDKLGRVIEEGETVAGSSFDAANATTTGDNGLDYPTWSGGTQSILRTQRVYDAAYLAFGDYGQQNLRGRVSAVIYNREGINSGVPPYDVDLYSYDDEGRVMWKVHMFVNAASAIEIKTKCSYAYDLQGMVLSEVYENLLSGASNGGWPRSGDGRGGQRGSEL